MPRRCEGSLANTPVTEKTTPCPVCGLKQIPTRSGKVPIHKAPEVQK